MKATDSHMMAMDVDSSTLASHTFENKVPFSDVSRSGHVVLIFVCLTVVTIAFSIAGLAVTFPAAEVIYQIEAAVPPNLQRGGADKKDLVLLSKISAVETSSSSPNSFGSVQSTQPGHPALVTTDAGASVSQPPPELVAESVPVGNSLEFDVVFTNEYPTKDTGILCKDLPRQTSATLASRQCAVSCAQDSQCRYFWAAVGGRCCLKAAYDTAAAMQFVGGKNSGQFCKLTSRGPVAAATVPSITSLPPPTVQQQQQDTTAVEDLETQNRDSADIGTRTQVAVIILGQMRSFLTPKVQHSQRFLVAPLQDQFGADNVHLYLCADPGHRTQLEAVRIAGAVPTVFEARSRTMFAHMATCYRKTIDHAASMNPPLMISWFVRSRFDNVFFENVPPLVGLAEDAVHARARRIGHGWKNIDNEMISYWMWGDVCGDHADDFQCVYRDTKQVDKTGKCMIMDDQFAYIPAAYAEVCHHQSVPNL